MRGRVEAGKSGGGNSYGYDVVKQFAADGRPVRGHRAINKAAIVRRIFSDYRGGKSSKAIAKQLNREAVAGPSGKGWGPSIIHGNPERGTGLLNNELYIGRLVWNRLRYMKNPDTGRRVSRANSESAIIVREAPELRIIDQALRIKQAKDKAGFWDRRRPRYLFSGLMNAGCAAAASSKSRRIILACATARNKGTCSNLTSIHRQRLEETVLGGLQHDLMDPALVEVCFAPNTRGTSTACAPMLWLRRKATGPSWARSARSWTGLSMRSPAVCRSSRLRTG